MKSIVYVIVTSLFLIILFASFSSLIVESRPAAVEDSTVQVLWFDDFEANTIKWLGVARAQNP